MAEIGRVAVQSQGLSWSLCLRGASSTPPCRLQRINASPAYFCLPLELRALYEKCGFKAAEGIRSEKFFNIQLPSVVMVNSSLRADR